MIFPLKPYIYRGFSIAKFNSHSQRYLCGFIATFVDDSFVQVPGQGGGGMIFCTWILLARGVPKIGENKWENCMYVQICSRSKHDFA